MRSRKYKIAGLAAVCLSLASAMLLMANQKPEVSRFGKPATAAQSNRVSLVEDWSHRHLVYSHPQTIIQNLRIQQQQRYVQQVLRRNYVAPRPISSRPISPFAPVDRWRPNPIPRPISFHEPEMTNDMHRDWAVVMNAANQTMGDGSFPAKYTFNVNAAPDCVNDFAVFMTDSNSGTGVDIYALNNLYVNASNTGVCSGTAPNVLWAYHIQTTLNGAPVGSPVLSADGTEVAWVESGTGLGAEATLHILKPYVGSGVGTADGTLAAPNTPPNSASGAAYHTCVPTAPGGGGTVSNACLYSIPFVNAVTDTGGTGRINTSSPYYDYSDDLILAGDDDGNLHLFINVFKGAAAEQTINGWPASVPDGDALGSPIFDETSEHAFVGDAGGQLTYVTVGAGPGYNLTAGVSWTVAAGAKIVDAPIVDSTTQRVFVFANSTAGAVVGEDDTSLTAGLRTGPLNVGADNTNLFHSGSFDNNYYASDTGAGTGTGNLYVCGNNGTEPELVQIAVAGGTIGAATDVFTAATANTECSPVTEFYNTPSTTDFLFFSVQANGNAFTDCSGEGCVYGANLSGASTVTISGAMPASGGASGIIVDNDSTDTAASNVYFSWLGNDSATYPCNGDTSGKGCTVQVSQLGLGSAGELVDATSGANPGGSTFETTNLPNPAHNGNVLIVLSHWDGVGITATSVTDNAGGGSNTYSALGGPINIGLNGPFTNYMQAWYAYNVHGAPTTFTVTYSAGVANIALVDVLEYGGLVGPGDPLDAGTIVTNTGTTPGVAPFLMSVPAPGGNTTADNETIIGLFATAQGGGFPFTAGTGFIPALSDATSFIEQEAVISSGEYGATADAFNNGINWGGIVVGFKNAVQ